MKNIWEGIISGLYPRHCPICREIVYPKGDTACRGCRNNLPYITGPRCRKCSKPVHNEVVEYCYDCAKKKHLYNEGIAAFEHKGKIKDAIYDIKYRNKREYLDFFADEVAAGCGERIKEWQADIIIPVPLYKHKEVKRGFNQAMEAAVRIGRRLNIPVSGEMLHRIKDTVPQKELTDKGRKKNVENAFIVDKNIVKFKKVIIADDIYTTGSTIDSCAGVLKNAGVEKIYFVTLSIGDGF